MPSHIWIPFLVLLISIFPNSYSGACTIVHHHVLALTLNLTVPDMNNIVTLLFNLFPCLIPCK